MSWRTVAVSGRSKLDYKMGYLVVRGEETRRVHLSEIAVLVIESTAVSITTYLLCELAKSKVKVIFCDEKHNPFSELTPYYGCHDTSDKVRKQVAWCDDNKLTIWTSIVWNKINNQVAVLDRFSNHDQAELLRKYRGELEWGDKSNREGHSAKVYWGALFGKDHSRGADNPINSALNYGYSILLSCFNRETVLNGYITQLGIFHNNIFNQFNLACDLMEPFRCIVDFNVRSNIPKKFEREEKYKMLQMVQMQLLIDGKKQYLVNAISIYCKSVFQALEKGDADLINYYKPEYEL